MRYLDLVLAPSKSHHQTCFSVKCLLPADPCTWRSKCKDAHHFHRIYTRSDHLEGLQTSNSSQSPPSTQTPSPTPKISPVSLDLLHHDMHGILHHLLALLDTAWQRLLCRFPLLDHGCDDTGRIEHHQPQQPKHLPTMHAV